MEISALVEIQENSGTNNSNSNKLEVSIYYISYEIASCDLASAINSSKFKYLSCIIHELLWV